MKPKVKKFEFCRCVNLHTLRCSVVVLCGDCKGDNLRKLYAKEMRRVRAPKTAPSYDEVISLIDKEKRSYSGLTCVDKSNADCCIFLPEWHSEVFVHEAYHAVRGIMDARDISEDPTTEIGAYLIERLFHEIVNTDFTDNDFKKRNGK